MARPRSVAVDARLAAYRGGGIAEHTRRLLAGIAALPAVEREAWRVTVLAHRRAVGGPGEVGGAGRTGVDPSDPSDPSDAVIAASAPGTLGDRADDVFRRRHLRTPPHHRFEAFTLPIDAALAGCPPRGLLHCPDVAVPTLWLGPIVATVHDVAFLRHPERLTADSLRYYARVHRTVRRARRVIAVSDHTARELTALTRIDPRRIRVVPNAVDDRFRPADGPADADADRAACARLGLTSPFVLFVSTIEPRKNVGVLLDAFAALARDRTDLTLALAGADGWHSEAITDHARDLGLGDRLRFLGWVPDDDLVALYRTAACLAHPAVDEGFGLTPVEAMACGTPTVVSAAGSLPEVTGDAALVVPPDDPAAWAEAIRRVLDDAALARCMAGAGRARAEGFTLERMARATLDVYREAVAGERR
ncbi:MAG: glycosyltransferase family 4 protein [Ardenticatenales bacterium]|nr:glycosyltransferase family 4 protein [Ardenticatenales bacterium]